MHTYTEGSTEHEEWTKVKHVPRSLVVAQFDGSWRTHVRWKRVSSLAPSSRFSTSSAGSAGDPEYATLLDVSRLHVVPKRVRPIKDQLPNESRRLWEGVTERLLRKEYGDATRAKQAIEQRQRDEAAERKRKGVEWAVSFLVRAYGLTPFVESNRCISRRTSTPGSLCSLKKARRRSRRSSSGRTAPSHSGAPLRLQTLRPCLRH